MTGEKNIPTIKHKVLSERMSVQMKKFILISCEKETNIRQSLYEKQNCEKKKIMRDNSPKPSIHSSLSSRPLACI
jgi:hypothetical protein